MKKKLLLMFCCLFSLFFGSTSHVYGIGITPGRCTKTMGENEGLDFGMQYYLIRPDTRYSCFDVIEPAGLISNITGFSSSTGIEVLNDQSILIDWNAAESFSWGGYEVVTASINVESPDPWQPPALPGCSYMGDLVRHIEMRESTSGLTASCSVISQIRLTRNFALKGEVSNLKDNYPKNEPVQLEIAVQEYLDTYLWLPWFDFSYSIDWESDGVVDDSQSGIRMVEDSQNHLYKYKKLHLGHVYTEPGNYLMTLNLTDNMETASIQIPIHVVPEPTTFSVVGFSSILFLKRKYRRRCI